MRRGFKQAHCAARNLAREQYFQSPRFALLCGDVFAIFAWRIGAG
jgi:hypothetical protein